MKLSSPFSVIRKSSGPVDAGCGINQQKDSGFSMRREGTLGLEATPRHSTSIFNRLFKRRGEAAASGSPRHSGQASSPVFRMPQRIERGESAGSRMSSSGEADSRESASQSSYSTKIVYSLNRVGRSRQSSVADSDKTTIRHGRVEDDSRRSSLDTTIRHEGRPFYFTRSGGSQSRRSSGVDSDRTMHRYSSYEQDSSRSIGEYSVYHSNRHYSLSQSSVSRHSSNTACDHEENDLEVTFVLGDLPR
jgi:hypothetical protein